MTSIGARFRALFFPLLLMTAQVAPSTSRAARADCVEGERCKIKVLDARTLQKWVGEKEIEIKLLDEIREARKDPAGFKRYLKENAGSVLLGPEGKIHLIDGHHFARALADSGVDEMYVEVWRDWSEKSPKKFWAKVFRKELAYPWDAQGRRIGPEGFPATVRGLRNDPYRSLAWMVKEAGGFDDLTRPFQEFAWARFFKESGIRIRSERITSYRRAFVEAMVLARSKAAAELPGYVGKSLKKQDACGLRATFDDLFLDN